MQTEFPADPTLRGLPAIVYASHRFYIGGATVARWLAFVWLGAAALWAIAALPGRWWVAGLWLLLWVVQTVVGARLQRRNYVVFSPQTAPPLVEEPLIPQEKLPIYGAGLFGVEGKDRAFTWLPGFYRTFATGEHALLCQARARRWLWLGEWLPDEVGMWYAFIPPDAILDVQWGRLAFGGIEADALAVAYRLTLPPNNRRKREEVRDETLYIAFDDPAIGRRIYADLLHHLPVDTTLASTQPLSSA